MKGSLSVNSIKELIYNRNPMQILSYLSKHANDDNLSSHIAKKISISIGSAHNILKQLNAFGIAKSKTIGKSIIYNVDKNNPILKAFRVFENLIELEPLVSKLKLHSRKIILFGSCSVGTDSGSSDVDLLIVADDDEKDYVFSVIKEFNYDREINPVLVDLMEYMEMENSDKIFYDEIQKGIELWEVSNEHN